MKQTLYDFWYYQIRGRLPIRETCGFCEQRFWARPTGKQKHYDPGDHENYCSDDCRNIQAGVDNYISHQETKNERRFLERFEHPLEV